MGCLTLVTIGVLLISVLIGLFVIYPLGDLPPLPDVKVTYWGPGKEKPDDPTIRPFKIAIPERELQYLQRKLNSSREPLPALEGTGFNYGVNSAYLKEFIKFWKTKYNWRVREDYLNTLPQYSTQIGGLNIHYIHAKPDKAKLKGQEIIPILLIHGWPGSVREFYQLIPLLTTPKPGADYVFEVIAPSLPGYGFSDPSSKPGLGTAQMGAILDHLMDRLGFKKYFVQGGDWGSIIGKEMAILYPYKVLGYHSNMCFSNTFNSNYRILLSYFFPSFFVEENKREAFLNQLNDPILKETGYLHIQATKPDTIGVALNDSPLGLAAYILEKFSTWTNNKFRDQPTGGLEKWGKEDLLDNIMIYWFSKSITSSMRLYSEVFNKNYGKGIPEHPVTVPTGCSIFPNEILYVPPYVLEGGFLNLLTVTNPARGGHFAAFEEPALLATDVWDFVKAARKQPKRKS